MMRYFIGLITCFASINCHAFHWQDLWYTSDQQGAQFMSKAQYKKAKEAFVRPDWAGAAAYRMGDYQDAAEFFKTLKTEQGFYNQGNALAHLGQYEQAIEAYNQALTLNPNNQDAQYNRQLLKELLKKDEEQKQKKQQNQNQPNKDQQNKDQQNKEQQNKDQQNKEQQNKEQQNKEQQNKEQQNKEQQNKEQQNKDQQNKDQANKNQHKQSTQKQAKAKQEQTQEANKKKALSEAEQEGQLAKEQWLKLIPEDPGGLMREKFLRDHLKRERGWDQ